MSIFVERQYINEISGYLDLFAWSKEYVANFRCNICGDSDSDATKKRGFFVRSDTDGFIYKCHNCGAALKLSTYLKEYFPEEYSRYSRDMYFERGGSKREEKVRPKQKPVSNRITKSLTGNKARKVQREPVLDNMISIADMDPEHPCRQYVEGRAIPEKHFKILYYAENFREAVAPMCEDHSEEDIRRIPCDQRLVIPFFDANGKLKAVQGRALDPKSTLRYATVKRNEDVNKIYGEERVIPNRTTLVVEGPIDSLFLPNCKASADADLLTVNGDIYIPDNQYRNKEICDRISKWIELGVKVVLFPPDLEWKDINDMVDPRKGNMSSRELLQLIADNVYSGLSAKLKFASLRKC